MKKLNLSKIQRIELRKQIIGSKHDRNLKKYSNRFNEIFNFFLKSYRSGLLDFCGSQINVVYDKDGHSGKECFRLFEDGFYKHKSVIVSRHPHIIKGVIVGKKSWGLWKDEWSGGISEGLFTKFEILQEFEQRNINLPQSLLEDFENTIWSQRFKKQKNNEPHFLTNLYKTGYLSDATTSKL